MTSARRSAPTAGRVVAVVLLAVNLRVHLASLAPLLHDVQGDLGLSEATAGLLTTLPVLCFAVGSAVVPAVAARLGTDRAVILALAVITLAVIARPWGGAALLFTGTIVLGLAITVGNVLLPVVTARDFPHRVSSMTSVGAASFSGGASLSAALAVPIAALIGWRAGSTVWAAAGVVGIAVWWWTHRGPGPQAVLRPRSAGGLWRRGTVWALAGYFGLQSALYYSVTTWLPSYLQATGGQSPEAAGLAMSAFQLFGIAGALATPLADRLGTGSPTRTAVGVGVLWFGSIGALLVAPGLGLVWGAVAGLAQGAGITTALLLIARRSTEVASASGLSALVQGVGYVIGAAGPFLVGAAVGAAGWAGAFGGLVAAAAGLAVLAPFAARSLRAA